MDKADIYTHAYTIFKTPGLPAEKQAESFYHIS